MHRKLKRSKKTLAGDWATWDGWKAIQLTRLMISDNVPLLTLVFEDVEVEELSDTSAAIRARFEAFGESQG